ncbi:MAG: PAS domain S-box protein [Limnochordia bacterium]|nr:PAS domain S-box protein [Limnochordia bacterium]
MTSDRAPNQNLGKKNSYANGFNNSSRYTMNNNEIDFVNITDYLPQGIRVIDTGYTVKYINASFARLSGVDTEDAIGQKCYDVFRSRFCHTSECRLARIIKGEKSVQTEIERTTGEGTVIPCMVSAFPMYDKDNNLVGIMESFRDISDKKLLEEQVIEAEERYKAMVDLSSEVGEGIVMLEDINDKEGVIVFASPQFSRLTGYTNDELIGKCFFELVVDDDRQAALERHRRKMKGESLPGHYKTYIIRKDGKYVPVESVSEALEFRDKNVYISYLRDISNQVKAETALKEYKKELETLIEERTSELNAALKREHELGCSEKKLREEYHRELEERVFFIRALVHDLKTPLTAIINSSDLLEDALQDQLLSNVARNIRSSAIALNYRVDELLDLSRSRIGKLSITPDIVDPMSILFEIKEEMSALVEKKGQSLIVKAPESLPQIWVERNRIKQVLYNLVENAIKYNRDKGHITIKVVKKGQYVKFEVKDEGNGIDVKELENIFLPFYRPESDKSRFSGLGLGLALSKTLIEMNGGKIWARNVESGGSIISFTTPLFSADKFFLKAKP